MMEERIRPLKLGLIGYDRQDIMVFMWKVSWRRMAR